MNTFGSHLALAERTKQRGLLVRFFFFLDTSLSTMNADRISARHPESLPFFLVRTDPGPAACLKHVHCCYLNAAQAILKNMRIRNRRNKSSNATEGQPLESLAGPVNTLLNAAEVGAPDGVTARFVCRIFERCHSPLVRGHRARLQIVVRKVLRHAPATGCMPFLVNWVSA